MSKEKLFEKIAKIPNFPSLEPGIVSIGPMPFRPNSRRLFSDPGVFQEIVNQLADKIKEEKIDRLIGGETAGIPLAAALSLKTNIPFAYVRKKPKDGRTGGAVEGDYKKGERVILVEDILGDGKTKLLFINHLEKAGLKVAGVMTIVWFKDYKFLPEFAEVLKKTKLHYLYTLEEQTRFQTKKGIIPKKLAPYILDYVKNPKSWSDKSKWLEYVEVLKSTNIKIPVFLNKYLK